MDGAAIVHLLIASNRHQHFDNYANSVFIISKQQESATRVDVVWDTYITSNIKESTRDKSGKGKQREVTTQ